jgi:alpha-maltose-1-phosphate synthase
MFLLSHPTGNQNMRHTALALREAQSLAEVWTCLAVDSGSPLLSVMPRGMRDELLRRSFPADLTARLHTRPWREAARLATRRLGWSAASKHETGWCSVDEVYRDLDRHIARRIAAIDGLSAVYAYEDGAAATFRSAKRLGLRRIYDLPIGYWRAFDAICAEEQELAPAWASTLVGTLDSPRKRARKDRELAQADQIIVASRFTAQTLTRYPGRLAPVAVIPYGAPTPNTAGRHWSVDGPLRVLYVGSLSQRKGLSYLFQAAHILGSGITLTVVGSRVATCPALDAALSPHQYHPSLPHDQVLRLMRDHDVLVFPSLFEGFGLVITEAMSQGMVVITTPNTAGPDVITDGADGFLVPIRDGQAIAERLERLRTNRELLASMGARALEASAQRGWDAFRRELAQVVL